MTRKASYKLLTQLLCILFIAFALKHFYSTAGANELRWILAPTTFLVELITGRTFNFEMHAGYMSSDRSFLIATSCAGVNFMIASFLMLTISKLWRRELVWKLIPAALMFSYVTTIVVNSVRISTALHLQDSRLDIAGLSANQLHRLEGIVIYFGFLLLLYLLSERRISTHTKMARLLQFILPLLVYYATTLAMPIANAVYRREFAAAFLEHSAFVLIAPLPLMITLVVISRQRTANRKQRTANSRQRTANSRQQTANSSRRNSECGSA